MTEKQIFHIKRAKDEQMIALTLDILAQAYSAGVDEHMVFSPLAQFVLHFYAHL